MTRKVLSGGEPYRLELIGGRGVSSGRGWTMYCDRCGDQLTSGGQFCTKCGKAIVPSGVASSPGSGQALGQTSRPAGAPAAAVGGSQGRGRGNIPGLGILWRVRGVFRLMGGAW